MGQYLGANFLFEKNNILLFPIWTDSKLVSYLYSSIYSS